MLYRFLADAVLVFHLAFVVFVVTGGFLALRWRTAPWVHLPAAAWGAIVMLMGWTCPLTPLENRLRALAGQEGYEGGFIEHYILSVLYPAGLTRELQVLLGLSVVAANALAYGILWLRRRKEREEPALTA